MGETDRRGKGAWRYVDRAVDKSEPPMDLLLTEHRETEAARRFLPPALCRHGVPATIPDVRKAVRLPRCLRRGE